VGVLNWLKDLFPKPRMPREHVDSRLISLVLLLQEPRCLDAEIIAQRLSDEWDRPIAAPLEGMADDYVSGEEPTFLVCLNHEFYLINHFSRPYMDDPQRVARRISEMRLQKAIERHQSWLSVDYLGEATTVERAMAFRTIGRIAASLLDQDCVAIFAPASGQLNLVDEQTADVLRSSQPLRALDANHHPPVIPVYGDDPRLIAAVAKARKRWPQFERAFENRQPNQSFSVKARIGNDHIAEFMWITVTGMENGWIYGRLDNDPIEITSIRCGDRVRVPFGDVNDWLIIDGQTVIGGFTIDVLRQIQNEL
jgi:uncharacterized protein YegJ (DUF2314 family)